jgi:hypothetical protein
MSFMGHALAQSVQEDCPKVNTSKAFLADRPFADPDAAAQDRRDRELQGTAEGRSHDVTALATVVIPSSPGARTRWTWPLKALCSGSSNNLCALLTTRCVVDRETVARR